MIKVYRISHCKYIDDLTGQGAARYSGRWHSKGTYMLYTAATASLALLESVVHISAIVGDYCMICLNVPDENIMELRISDLPAGWFLFPPPDKLKIIGDNFIREGRYLALKIPSAIMPEENNILLNPNHSDYSRVKLVFKRTIPIDNRRIPGR